MNFLNLVHLIVAREEWEKSKHFEKHTAQTPIVHLVIVVAISHQALWRSIPSCANVLSEGWLTINTATGAEIGQFDLVVLNENIFRFNIAMENTILMHMVDCLDDLIHVIAHSSFWQVVPATFNCLVQIHVHQLEDERQSACGLIVKDFVQCDNVGVGRKSFQCLNFSQIVNLVYVLEVCLHALDSHVFV